MVESLFIATQKQLTLQGSLLPGVRMEDPPSHDQMR